MQLCFKRSRLMGQSVASGIKGKPASSLFFWEAFTPASLCQHMGLIRMSASCESTRAYTCSLRHTCGSEACWGPVLEEMLEAAFWN